MQIGERSGSQDTSLHYAAEGGSCDVLELLLSVMEGQGGECAGVNSLGFADTTPLFSAVENCRGTAIDLLLSRGADVNATDQWSSR